MGWLATLQKNDSQHVIWNSHECFLSQNFFQLRTNSSTPLLTALDTPGDLSDDSVVRIPTETSEGLLLSALLPRKPILFQTKLLYYFNGPVYLYPTPENFRKSLHVSPTALGDVQVQVLPEQQLQMTTKDLKSSLLTSSLAEPRDFSHSLSPFQSTLLENTSDEPNPFPVSNLPMAVVKVEHAL